MSIDRLTFLGFASELTKMGFFNMGNLGQHVKNWARLGWSGPAPTAGMDPAAALSQHRMARLGQGLQIVGTAAQLPGAMKKEDPKGLGRTRTERVSELAGQTAGGLVAGGASMAAVSHLGLQPGMGGTLRRMGTFLPRNAINFGLPMAGALIAGRLASAPSRAARMRRIQERQREMGAQDNEAPGAVSPGLHGTPAESPGAQEGQQGQMR